MAASRQRNPTPRKRPSPEERRREYDAQHPGAAERRAAREVRKRERAKWEEEVAARRCAQCGGELMRARTGPVPKRCKRCRYLGRLASERARRAAVNAERVRTALCTVCGQGFWWADPTGWFKGRRYCSRRCHQRADWARHGEQVRAWHRANRARYYDKHLAYELARKKRWRRTPEGRAKERAQTDSYRQRHPERVQLWKARKVERELLERAVREAVAEVLAP